MECLGYNANILPTIILAGKQYSDGNYKTIKRTLNEYVFYFVKSGDVYLCEKDVNYHLKSGDCLLLEAKVNHFGTKKSACDFYYFHFSHPDIIKRNVSFPDKPKQINHTNNDRINVCKYFSVKNSSAFMTLCDLSEQITAQINLHESAFGTYASCLLTQFFILLWKEFSYNALNTTPYLAKCSALTNSVLEYLKSNYQYKISSEIIEKNFSYSFEHLNKLFKSHMNTTIFKALEMIRIDSAKKLLIASNLSIKEIAVRTGYFDNIYFSKVFKKTVGTTPTKYRQSIM